MADKIITVPEPTATSTGVQILIGRRATNLFVHVAYTLAETSANVMLEESDFTAAQLTTLNSLVSAIVNKAKPKMGF